MEKERWAGTIVRGFDGVDGGVVVVVVEVVVAIVVVVGR